MVERLHLSPNKVRGGGYLLSQIGVEKFMKKGCLLSVQDMTVLEETMPVYTMHIANDTNLVISATNTGYDYQMLTLPDGTVWYSYFEGEYFQVDGVLSDSNDVPISGENVYMIGSSATADYQVTDSDGEFSFYFNMDSQVFSIQAQFLNESPQSGYVDAMSNIVNVQCGGCDIDLAPKQNGSVVATVGYKEAFSLEATVFDSIRNVGMSAGIIVSFYNGSTLLGTATTDSNGVATLNNVKIITNEGITAKIGDETSEPITLTVTTPIVTVVPGRYHSYIRQGTKIYITVTDGNGHGVVGETVYFCNGNANCSYARLGETGADGKITTTITKTVAGMYSVYAGVDRDGIDVRSESVIVTYHDTLPDSLSLSVSPSIIELGGSASLTGLLTGTEAGAEIPMPDFNVSFYETYTPALGVSVDNRVIQSGETANVSVQMKDTDGSLVRQDGLTVRLYQSNAYALSVSADKSVLSYYDEDSAVLTATLEGPNVSGRSVVFKQGDTVLSTVTTNSRGVATYTYNSQGVGDVTITAECMNLQETYSIEDCLLYQGMEKIYSNWTKDLAVSGRTIYLFSSDYQSDVELTFKIANSIPSTFLVGFGEKVSSSPLAYWSKTMFFNENHRLGAFVDNSTIRFTDTSTPNTVFKLTTTNLHTISAYLDEELQLSTDTNNNRGLNLRIDSFTASPIELEYLKVKPL